MRGFLRWYLLWDVLVTCALKLAFIHYQHWDEHAHRIGWPLYYPLWLRAYLMLFQSACYLALSVPTSTEDEEICPSSRRYFGVFGAGSKSQ